MYFGAQATPFDLFVSRSVAATSAAVSLSFDAKQCSLEHLGTPQSEMSHELHGS